MTDSVVEKKVSAAKPKVDTPEIPKKSAEELLKEEYLALFGPNGHMIKDLLYTSASSLHMMLNTNPNPNHLCGGCCGTINHSLLKGYYRNLTSDGTPSVYNKYMRFMLFDIRKKVGSKVKIPERGVPILTIPDESGMSLDIGWCASSAVGPIGEENSLKGNQDPLVNKELFA